MKPAWNTSFENRSKFSAQTGKTSIQQIGCN